MESLKLLLISTCFTFQTACAQEGEAISQEDAVLKAISAWEATADKNISSIAILERLLDGKNDFVILTRVHDPLNIRETIVVEIGPETFFEFHSISQSGTAKSLSCIAPKDILHLPRLKSITAAKDNGFTAVHPSYRFVATRFGKNFNQVASNKVHGKREDLGFSDLFYEFDELEAYLLRVMVTYCGEYKVREHEFSWPRGGAGKN